MATPKKPVTKTAGIGKGTPGPGRPKGVPNKTTQAQRHAIHQAFERLGGIEALVRFGQSDPKSFYALWGKTIPQEHTGPDGGPIVHEHQVWLVGGRKVVF